MGTGQTALCQGKGLISWEGHLFKRELTSGGEGLYLGGKGSFQAKWLLSRKQGHI